MVGNIDSPPGNRLRIVAIFVCIVCSLPCESLIAVGLYNGVIAQEGGLSDNLLI